MKASKFILGLLFIIVLLSAILYSFYRNPEYGIYKNLGIISMAVFSALSIIQYIVAHKASNSSDKYLFINMIIGNFLAKLIITVLLILIYYKMTNPTDGKFVVPFIIVYVGFTIFETYFLHHQAKIKG